jgi:hypothetical protein
MLITMTNINYRYRYYGILYRYKVKFKKQTISFKGKLLGGWRSQKSASASASVLLLSPQRTNFSIKSVSPIHNDAYTGYR